ncbi:hypothetical protein L218DRAFT_963066 [Marasmius fiardii PR-910]|nr:hypothetical protein L218DRAFT_963066 [Marasmius fiardii PR-910]
MTTRATVGEFKTAAQWHKAAAPEIEEAEGMMPFVSAKYAQMGLTQILDALNCSKLQASTASKDDLVYSLYSHGVKLGNDIIKAHNLKEPMVWGRNIAFLNEMQAFRDKAHNKAKKTAQCLICNLPGCSYG